ncbi:hypothetical protein ACS0TY_027483 [Phlomoides rotata]
MKVSDNIKTGKKVVNRSWKNAMDPAAGSIVGELQALDIPQYFLKKNGHPHWRSGQWNGWIFIGIRSQYDTR